MKDRLERFQVQMNLWQLMEATGAHRDPVALDMWQRGMSPLANGREAARFQERLEGLLTTRWLAGQIVESSEPAGPQVDPVKAIVLGESLANGEPVVIDVDTLNCHMLVMGASGSGKTTLLGWLISQLADRNA